MNPEMVERLVLAANGGSFANVYAKRYAVRVLVRTIEAMTIADVEAILFDKRFDEASAVNDRHIVSATLRAGRAT